MVLREEETDIMQGSPVAQHTYKTKKLNYMGL
jgi:hypothetical protein